MMIGGEKYYGATAETFYYDHTYGNWSNGPMLNQARYGHAVGIGKSNFKSRISPLEGRFYI